MIVSNSAGTNDDHHDKEAEILEKATGVEVFRHPKKKPGCAIDVLNYLRSGNVPGLTRPDQVVVVGDRIFTDVIMANMMGAWSIWVKDGVARSNGVVRLTEVYVKHLTNECTVCESREAATDSTHKAWLFAAKAKNDLNELTGLISRTHAYSPAHGIEVLMHTRNYYRYLTLDTYQSFRATNISPALKSWFC